MDIEIRPKKYNPDSKTRVKNRLDFTDPITIIKHARWQTNLERICHEKSITTHFCR